MINKIEVLARQLAAAGTKHERDMVNGRMESLNPDDKLAVCNRALEIVLKGVNNGTSS